MAQAQRAIEAKHHRPAGLDEIPTLVSDLGDELTQLLDAKVGLLKLEVKEEVATYVLNGAMVAGGAALAGIGLLFGSLAIVFGISSIFLHNGFGPGASYGISFVIVGVTYFVIGVISALVFSRKLSAHDPTPERTVQELRKDKRWLKQEL